MGHSPPPYPRPAPAAAGAPRGAAAGSGRARSRTYRGCWSSPAPGRARGEEGPRIVGSSCACPPCVPWTASGSDGILRCRGGPVRGDERVARLVGVFWSCPRDCVCGGWCVLGVFAFSGAADCRGGDDLADKFFVFTFYRIPVFFFFSHEHPSPPIFAANSRQSLEPVRFCPRKPSPPPTRWPPPPWT
jgi:hypothetical protein